MDRKYLPIIIGLIVSLGIFFTLITLSIIQPSLPINIIPPEYVSEFILIIPGPMVTDIIILYLLPVIFFGLFYVLAPYFVIFYIKIHQFFYWLIRRPSKYGIAALGTKIKAGRLFYRSLIVSLFTFSMASVIVLLGYGNLFRPNFMPHNVLFEAEAILLGTFCLTSIILLVFFPIWLLEDSGIVSYRVYPEERMPIDIQGAHSIYLHVLLGYAGVSTLFTLINYIIKILDILPPGNPAILIPILLIFLPLVVTGLFSIPIFFYERLFQRIQKRLLSHLPPSKYPEIKIPSFEEIEVPKTSM
jgi:hypothetical protein